MSFPVDVIKCLIGAAKIKEGFFGLRVEEIETIWMGREWWLGPAWSRMFGHRLLSSPQGQEQGSQSGWPYLPLSHLPPVARPFFLKVLLPPNVVPPTGNPSVQMYEPVLGRGKG